MSLQHARKQLQENLDILKPIAQATKENIYFYNISAAMLNMIQAIDEIDQKLDEIKSKQSSCATKLAFLVDKAEE